MCATSLYVVGDCQLPDAMKQIMSSVRAVLAHRWADVRAGKGLSSKSCSALALASQPVRKGVASTSPLRLSIAAIWLGACCIFAAYIQYRYMFTAGYI